MWIGAPVFLFPYLDVHIVEDADITDCSDHVGKVSGDLIFVVVRAWRSFQYSVVYCVGVDPQVKAAFVMSATAA